MADDPRQPEDPQIMAGLVASAAAMMPFERFAATVPEVRSTAAGTARRPSVTAQAASMRTALDRR